MAPFTRSKVSWECRPKPPSPRNKSHAVMQKPHTKSISSSGIKRQDHLLEQRNSLHIGTLPENASSNFFLKLRNFNRSSITVTAPRSYTASLLLFRSRCFKTNSPNVTNSSWLRRRSCIFMERIHLRLRLPDFSVMFDKRRLRPEN
jgi:hypothetical protein